MLFSASWPHKEYRRAFFENYASMNGFNPLVPENWYTHLTNLLAIKVSICCFCFVLFCFVLFCFVLFCFVLFCFVLFCFVLFCFVLNHSLLSFLYFFVIFFNINFSQKM